MPNNIKSNIVRINQSELEKFLGVSLINYDICEIGERDKSVFGKHDMVIHPITLFEALLEHGLSQRLKNLTPLRQGSPKTGEIWRTGYGIIAMYWAPLPQRGDSVIIMGGDTSDSGRFEVIGKGDLNDSFYKMIFSPVTGNVREV